MLEGVRIALGVTGSIAAVKTVELAHELRRRGATVRAITTPATENIVHPWALEFATGEAVVTELTGAVEHVELCGRDGWADVLLVAPATANTVGKMAAAIDDTPVTTAATTAIGADLPVVVAPAMHEPMHDHPGVGDSLDRLREWGIEIVPPRLEEGKAKIATEAAIANTVARVAGDGALAGESIVVSAGGTVSDVDPVRVLANRASGRMGREIAIAAAARGADVTLVHGQVGPHPLPAERPDLAVDLPNGVSLATVETTTELETAVLEASDGAAALVSAAAVGDFSIDPRDGKLDSGHSHAVTLEPAGKVIDAVHGAHPDLPIVPFKLESGALESLHASARALRERVNAPFVVANLAETIAATESSAWIVDREGETGIDGSKRVVAERIIDELTTVLTED